MDQNPRNPEKDSVDHVRAYDGINDDVEARGAAFFKRLGWKRLTIVLIVEAIALGSLGLPSAFATLGMVAGVILSIGFGFVAIYTSYIIGQVKLKYPHVSHYADAGALLGERFGHARLGWWIVGAMFALQLTFLVGSHCLTGTIAFLNLTDNGACSVVFGAVSAVILLLLAIPPSFADVATLGYVDFASVIVAVGITIIATGIQGSNQPGGLEAVEWSNWPKSSTFADAFVSIATIVFAYSFSICQFSFMDEMHTPEDFVKSIWALGIIEIVIYTGTGAIVYAFVGQGVRSPALLSAGGDASKWAFGFGLPVIFISGSINTTVVGRFIHGHLYRNSPMRFINTKAGWVSWLAVISIVTVVAWVIANSVPFFNDLLSLSSALFISGFTLYFPAWMWFSLIKEGKWSENHNIPKAIANALIFVAGLIVLVGGTYSSIVDIRRQYKDGGVVSPFQCAPIS